MRAVILIVITSALAAGQGAANQPVLRPPVTAKDRLQWLTANTVGPENLLGQGISSAWATMLNEPPEYGPHWEGFGKRFGMSLTGVATSNMMEVGLGALWGEDPGYERVPGRPFIKRMEHILKFTLVTENRRGRTVPAYARYAAYVGSNFLSNTWRADGEATNADAAVRIGLGFLGRMGGNAWHEFWPDVKQKLFH